MLNMKMNRGLWIALSMIHCPLSVSFAQTPVYLDETKPVEQRIDDALARMTLDEKIAVIHAQSKFSSPGVKRLGFPDLWTDDGYRGKHVILGPGVNINRTPFNGRNFEYMGEDPWLASRMVVPYIQGLQSKGVAACVKHYALNNDEEYRHQVNVIVSDRALHEIYLPAFKAAIQEGGAWAVMGSYNLYQNQHNCHNATLLNKILKQDWGFDGVVISDWGGCHNTEEAIQNGLDLEFGSWTDGLTMGVTNAYDNYYMALPYKRLIREFKYSTKELDEKVRRVLRLFYRTTMNRQRPFGFLCSESHYEAALKIAQQGIVLLKNDRKILPVKKARRILVVGENAIKMMTVGGGSSSLKVQKEILPLDGIKARFAEAEVDFARGYVGDTIQSYDGVTVGRSLYDLRSAEELTAEAVAKAKDADVVIFIGGLNKSNYQDCEGHDRQTYGLPYGQDQLIEALVKANPNLVYVNISGNAVAMPWADKVPAIVDCGAHATGSYPGTWREAHQIIDETYKEDIFVGYRWTDKQQIKPLFPFGYGLSYTTFQVSNLRADKKEMTADDQLTITADVKNVGSLAGAEVLQLYISDTQSSLPRPVKELKGFKKVYLEPGETQQVSFIIDRSALSFYDEKTGAWTAEPGEFVAMVNNSSAPTKNHIRFILSSKTMQ